MLLALDVVGLARVGDRHRLDVALDELAAVLADRPVAAADAASGLSDRLGRHPDCPPDVLLAAAETLSAQAGVASGLLAVAFAEQGAAFGWPVPWRDLVGRLRGHRNADVRSTALDVVMTS